MIRSTSIATVLFASVIFASGCESASDEQNRANKAQIEANEKITAAAREADDKIKSAQLEADKKIAEANASFLKMREDYRHDTTVALVELDKKIELLEAKSKKATGKAKAELDARLTRIRADRESFMNDYKTLENDTAVTWDKTKARLEKSWTDLKNYVDAS